MPADMPAHLQLIVDTLCAQGCARVGKIIEQLRQGDEIEETRGLSAEERAAVLAELVNIMEVYDKR